MPELSQDFPGFIQLDGAGILRTEDIPSREDLLKIEGIGPARADQILLAAQQANTPPVAPETPPVLDSPSPAPAQSLGHQYDETVPGGRYKIGSSWVNAEGDPISG